MPLVLCRLEFIEKRQNVPRTMDDAVDQHGLPTHLVDYIVPRDGELGSPFSPALSHPTPFPETDVSAIPAIVFQYDL